MHRHPCTRWTSKHTSRYKKQTNCKNSFCLSNNSSLQKKNLRLNVYCQNTLSPGTVKGAISPPTPPPQAPALLGCRTPGGGGENSGALSPSEAFWKKNDVTDVSLFFPHPISFSCTAKDFASLFSPFSFFFKLLTFLQCSLIPLNRGTVLLTQYKHSFPLVLCTFFSVFAKDGAFPPRVNVQV